MRALIAEDDSVSRRVLQATLAKWGYDVVVAHDGQQAWEILRQADGPNLAILDWMMPNMDGVEVCRRVRSITAQRGYIYVILLTAKGRKEDLIDGMDGGADDYLVKPVDLAEFRAHLRVANRILELQAKLLAAHERLRDQATHDPLTGVWNRLAILDALERDLARARREQAPVSVLLGDLDHFKRINDTYGHDAGDQALCQAAKRMLSVIRRYDTLGRYGGEEFLIVAPGCESAGAAALAERIRRRMAAEAVFTDQHPLTLTISIGVVTGEGGGPDSASLIQAADQAMYRAKGAGRNRVEVTVLAAAVGLT
ncbi:MAG: diguanylate cyclase [Phycisphaerae bacterium]|nr:diguanylate cyclase [Phycisphaerae bacterium]